MPLIPDETLKCWFRGDLCDGQPHEIIRLLVAEIMTWRSYVPALQAVVDEHENGCKAEKLRLEQAAKAYAAEQIRMIDEIRQMRAAMRASRSEGPQGDSVVETHSEQSPAAPSAPRPGECR